MAKSHELRRRDNDSIRILSEAVKVIPPSDRPYVYPYLAYLLCRRSQSREAVTMLRAAYKQHVSSVPQFWQQLEDAMFIAHDMQSVPLLETVASAVDTSSPVNSGQRALGRMLALEQQGEFRRAAESASREEMSGYPPLVPQVAFCWLCCGEISNAQAVISEFTLPNNTASLWMLACVYYCAGRDELALEAMERIVVDDSSADMNSRLLLETWDLIPGHGSTYPAYYFPVLPMSFTGLDVDVYRLIGRSSALSLTDWTSVRLPRGTPKPVEARADWRQARYPAVEAGNIIFNQIGEFAVSKYDIGGIDKNYGSIGDESSTVNQGWLNSAGVEPARLALELEELKKRMTALAVTDSERASIGEVEGAISAIDSGDAGEARSRLARAGTWAVGVATSIGREVAAAAIKAAIGL
jgi:hypothetical protein